jgi:hypothetical protein
MLRESLSLWHVIVASPFLFAAAANGQPKTTLKKETINAFEAYVTKFEKKINDRISGAKPFLWIDTQNPDSRDRARRGEALIFKSDENVDVPDGIIHVWGVTAFVAGARTEDAVKLLLDYNRHKNVYPSVTDSRILAKDGDTVKGYLRFRYTKAITVVLNSEHLAKLTKLGQGRYSISVRSTRFAEVAGFGTPDERELPEGKDSGFLWRLNSYWFLDQKKDGIFIECQSLTLSRNIPFGLGWIIGSFVESIPRDSLKELIEGTRKALRK